MTGKSLKAHRVYFASIRPRTSVTGFFDDACKDFYQRRLLFCHKAFRIRLHAYLLLEKQILLLFTPLTASGFESFIKFLNRSYNEYYMIRFRRRPQVWGNAATVCLPQVGRQVRDSQKFIERTALSVPRVRHPGQYAYSSYCANAFALQPKPLARHRYVSEILHSSGHALQSYRDFIATPFGREYEELLRSCLIGRVSTPRRLDSRNTGL